MILDRIEGEIAVLELANGECISLPASLLPKGVKEGDVLMLSMDADATQARMQAIQEKRNRLFRD